MNLDMKDEPKTINSHSCEINTDNFSTISKVFARVLAANPHSADDNNTNNNNNYLT